jgi:2-dehydropantoate 2-reductase
MTNRKPEPQNLRFLSFGAGAIGTYVGGSLALSGCQVVYLEQPAVAEELRERGLRLNLSGKEHHLPDPMVAAEVATALALGPFDAALFALKSFDTPAAIRNLAPYTRDLPPFICLQNGVDNEPLLVEALGAEKVIAGTVTSAIGRRGVGNVILERRRGIGISGETPLARSVVMVMAEAGLNAFLYPREADMKWSKLLTNLLANASAAILDMTPAEIFAHPGLYRLEVEQLREALRVMGRLDVRPVNLPGTPVRLLAFAVRSLPLKLSRPLLARAVGGGRGAKMPSFHIDLHSGRGLSEVEYLNGAVARYGEQVGVKTPVNRVLTEILSGMTKGEISLEEYRRKPDRLLGRV